MYQLTPGDRHRFEDQLDDKRSTLKADTPMNGCSIAVMLVFEDAMRNLARGAPFDETPNAMIRRPAGIAAGLGDQP